MIKEFVKTLKEKNKIEIFTYVLIFVTFMGSKFLRTSIFGININLARCLLIILALIFCIDVIRNWRFNIKCQNKTIKYILSFFIIWSIFSLVSIYKNEDLMFYIVVNFYICIGTISIMFFNRFININKNLINYFYIIESACLINCLYYLYLYFVFHDNIGGFYHNSNDLATVLILAIEIAIYLLIKSKNWRNLLTQFVILLIFIFSFINIMSRGCILGVLVAICISLVLFVIKNNKTIFKNKKRILGFVIFLIVCIFLGFSFYKKYVGDISIKPVDNAVRSNDVRVNLIYNGIYFLQKDYNFFTGIGTGNTIVYLRERSIYSIHKIYSFHNMWLELLVEYGVFIFCGFSLFYILVLNKLYRMSNIRYSYQNLIFLFFFMSFALSSISSSTILTREWVWILFAITIAFINVKDKKRTNIGKEKNIIFNTMIPLWSMNNKSGGKALFSTIKAYLDNDYNVYLITDQRNDYRDLEKIKKDHICYFDTSWYNAFSSKHHGFILHIVTFIYFKIFEIKSYNIACNLVENIDGKIVLYAYEVNSVIPLKKVQEKYNVPLVTRFQGTIMSQYDNNLYYRIRKYPHITALSTKSDLIIMTDDGTQGDQVLAKYKNDSPCLFIRNGVNILDNKVKKINKNIYYKKFGFPQDVKVLLTVSRLTSWKRVERSIYAFDKLNDKEKYRLIIIGDGDSRESLESIVEELKLKKYIKFLGSVENAKVKDYMQFADIFLSFYDLSNVGNPLLEALCLGKPIITYNVGDTNKIIDNKNGILLDDVSPENIATTIEKLDDSKLSEYSKNALEYSKENLYSWDKRMKIEVERVDRLYE